MFIRTISALVAFFLAGGAQAHVSAVLFPEIGSLQDAVHQAALGTVGGRQSIPQITCNLVTGVASVGGPCTPTTTCTDNHQTVTRNVSITSGTKILDTNGVSTFSFPGTADVGKTILVQDMDSAGSGGFNTIATVNSATNVTLQNNSNNTLSNISKAVTFGTNDSPAFVAFKTWALANQGSNQVVLTVPSGSNCWLGGVFGAGGNIFAGIKNLIVEGTGATISSLGAGSFSLGGAGMCFRGLNDVAGCSARLKNVSAGATQIELSAASYSAGYISRFAVGKTVMVGGLDPQSFFSPTTGYGDPTNLVYFEWRKIIAICNNTVGCVGTAIITLDASLVDAYSNLWPEYNAGDSGHSDGAGPATVWVMGDSWDATAEYRGLTISQDGQTYGVIRNLVYRNVTFTGAHGGIPTQNEYYAAINTDMSSMSMETDKLVGTMLFDGVTIYKVTNQSTATKKLIVKNSTFSGELLGGAQTTELSDSTFNTLSPGIFAYGSTGTANPTTCTRCTITNLSYNVNYNDNGSGAFSKSSGVIKFSNSQANQNVIAQRYFVPGGTVYFRTYNTNPPISFSCCESLGSLTAGTITADPWPALDNQTLTTTVNITSGSKSLNVPSGPFVSGDVGKTIIVIGAAGGSGNLYTFITGFSSATTVTLFDAAGTTVAGSQTIQWGTSNTYVQTSQPGGFPSVTAFNSNNQIGIVVSSSSNFTCDTCNTGNPTSDAYASSVQAGATPGKPLGSYYSRPFTPAPSNGTLATIPGRGLFKSLRINVTTAYTGGASFIGLNPAQFFWTLIDQSTPTAPAIFNWTPSNFYIALNTVGDRVITPSGITCNGVAGGCVGDTVNFPGGSAANLANMWVQASSFQPYVNTNAGGSGTAPVFTLTFQTDPIQ